jgi:hypothetical protein
MENKKADATEPLHVVLRVGLLIAELTVMVRSSSLSAEILSRNASAFGIRDAPPAYRVSRRTSTRKSRLHRHNNNESQRAPLGKFGCGQRVVVQIYVP